MLQLPLNDAPVWMLILSVLISPLIVAFSFRVSSSDTLRLPVNLPSIIAFWQSTSPSTIPDGPMITRPLQNSFPTNSPSILISLLALIVPSNLVPVTILLLDPDTIDTASFFCFLLFCV